MKTLQYFLEVVVFTMLFYFLLSNKATWMHGSTIRILVLIFLLIQIIYKGICLTKKLADLFFINNSTVNE